MNNITYESSFDEFISDPERKKSFEKGYKEFLLSELDISLAEKDEKSIILIKKEILKLNHYVY